MNIAEGLLGLFIGLQVYSAFILPYCYGITEDIEDYSPKVLYIAATAMLLFFFSFSISIWPIWGWKTFPMLIVMFFGYISSSAFLPGNFIGALASIFIFVACIYSHLYIKHDGKWHH
jgi:ABC-type Co2+ transport system permease subunit